jgi:aminoglycoside phosphotransferase (APT) family kinase protein
MMSTGMGLPRLLGFPSRDATLARYAQLSGRQARQINWFEAYAGLRIAMLVTRTANKLIELGMAEDTTMSFNNPATIALADLLGLPAPFGELGWITDRGRAPVLPPIPDRRHH